MAVTDPTKIRIDGSKPSVLRSLRTALANLYTYTPGTDTVDIQAANLTVNGVALPSGTIGLIPLETYVADNTVTGHTFSTGFTSAYKRHLFVGDNIVPATDGTALVARVGIASSIKSGGTEYEWTQQYVLSSTATAGLSDTSDSEVEMSSSIIGSAANEGVVFHLWLPDPTATTIPKRLYGEADGVRTDGLTQAHRFNGTYKAGTEAITDIRVQFLSGNMESGTITHYGLVGA